MAKKTYVEQFAQLSNDQQPKDLVVPFLTPEQGKPLVGILVGVEPVQNEKIAEPCNRYILDMDDGMGSVLMGSATDKQLQGVLEIGKLTYIEYLGKQEIQNGAKQVNRWKVLQVSI